LWLPTRPNPPPVAANHLPRTAWPAQSYVITPNPTKYLGNESRVPGFCFYSSPPSLAACLHQRGRPEGPGVERWKPSPDDVMGTRHGSADPNKVYI